MKRQPTASALIDWPVRERRCAHGQNEPCCYTRVNKCLPLPPGKAREPLPSSQQSPPSTDRVGQDELIHKTATWLLDLHHAGFWPCMDLRVFSRWCASLSLSLSRGLQILQVYVHFEILNIKVAFCVKSGGEVVVEAFKNEVHGESHIHSVFLESIYLAEKKMGSHLWDLYLNKIRLLGAVWQIWGRKSRISYGWNTKVERNEVKVEKTVQDLEEFGRLYDPVAVIIFFPIGITN